MTNDIKTGVKSHPTMSAWIEIFQSMIQKSLTPSHPTMGAWIEITIAPTAFAEHEESHPTMGAWIEILDLLEHLSKKRSRTPRWVRGLKSIYSVNNCCCSKSHPTMGAWIEILRYIILPNFDICVAPHDGCVD